MRKSTERSTSHSFTNSTNSFLKFLVAHHCIKHNDEAFLFWVWKLLIYIYICTGTFAPMSSTTAATTLLFRSGLSLGHTCFNILLSIVRPFEERMPLRLFSVMLGPPCCWRQLTKRSPGCKHEKEMFNDDI